uniref:2Fe-2S ferredoxin-type domain-containing protein n=1 Tax=Chromera velia CCMP2878 TaxID=1169474 RepID=A0A0G4FKB9_9ALVE|eukprot:Cvel_17484.t1-p1 / transcript=Cvel_17484.t1 / gene=Cvel_17484 / organism=Chromera_velia_CCMP2878 / gene_product=Indole-3-acetaldehyde oxidase, putative / transcript_product=Indole-3-acetaldehyde oxidase, putative / location=Cvel_scaffold1399:9513-28907(+) / protein_length=1658 / sequence_SO=supercontig / SO=protein_coding / is_pseudo=false
MPQSILAKGPGLRSWGGDSGGGSLVFWVNGKKFSFPAKTVDPNLSLAEFLRERLDHTEVKVSCGEGGCGACSVLVQCWRGEKEKGGEETGSEAEPEWEERTMLSCLTPIGNLHGKAVVTSKGLMGTSPSCASSSSTGCCGGKEKGEGGCAAKGKGKGVCGVEEEAPHPVHKKIAEFGGLQCGYCTPGMSVNIYAGLRRSARRQQGRESATKGTKEGEEEIEEKDLEGILDNNICRCTGYRPLSTACKAFCADGDLEELALASCKEGPAERGTKCPPHRHKLSWEEAKTAGDAPSVLSGPSLAWHRPRSLRELIQRWREAQREGREPRIVAAGTGAGIYKDCPPIRRPFVAGSTSVPRGSLFPLVPVDRPLSVISLEDLCDSSSSFPSSSSGPAGSVGVDAFLRRGGAAGEGRRQGVWMERWTDRAEGGGTAMLQDIGGPMGVCAIAAGAAPLCLWISGVSTLTNLRDFFSFGTHPSHLSQAFEAAGRHLELVATEHVRNSATVGGNLTLCRERGFQSDVAPLLLSLGGAQVPCSAGLSSLSSKLGSSACQWVKVVELPSKEKGKGEMGAGEWTEISRESPVGESEGEWMTLEDFLEVDAEGEGEETPKYLVLGLVILLPGPSAGSLSLQEQSMPGPPETFRSPFTGAAEGRRKVQREKEKQPEWKLVTHRVAARPRNAHAHASAFFWTQTGADGKMQSCRLVAGAVQPRPVVLRGAERIVIEHWRDGSLSSEALRKMLEAVGKEAPADPELFRKDKEKTEYANKVLKAFAQKSFGPPPLSPVDRVSMATETPSLPPIKARPTVQGAVKKSEDKQTHRPVPKQDSIELASGEARYLRDVPIPRGTLHAALVQAPGALEIFCRSTFEKARSALVVKGEDDKEGKVGKVVEVLDAEDLFGEDMKKRFFSFFGMDHGPLVAFPFDEGQEEKGEEEKERTTYAGQPVAVVLAESPEEAERGAAFMAREGLKQKDPAGATDRNTTGKGKGKSDPLSPSEWKRTGMSYEGVRGDPSALLSSSKSSSSSPKKDLKEKDIVKVSGSLSMGSCLSFYLEPLAVMAVPEEGQRMFLWSPTQMPGDTQRVVADLLGVPFRDVQLKVRRMGGAFGAKTLQSVFLTAVTARTSQVTGRPVRLSLNRNADLALQGGREEFEVQYSAAVDKEEGKILAVELQTLVNGGYAPGLCMVAAQVMAQMVDQAYFFPNFRVGAELCLSPLAPRTTVRGPGHSFAAAAMETVMDHCAAESGVSAEELRLRHLYGQTEGERLLDLYSSGEIMAPGDKLGRAMTLGSLWEQMTERSEWKRRVREVVSFNNQHSWRKRGIAMTASRYDMEAGSKEAQVVVYPDGSVTVHTDGVEVGQGLQVKCLQAAADALSEVFQEEIEKGGKEKEKEVLRLPVDLFRVAELDSTVLPNAGVTGGSTTSELCCQAVRSACRNLVKGALAERKQKVNLETALQESGSPEERARRLWKKIVAQKGEAPLSAVAVGKQDAKYQTWSVAVTEVEVDATTGEKRILRSDLLIDLGRAVNPLIDIGQSEGSFIQGLGLFSQEEVEHRDVGETSEGGGGGGGSLVNDGTWEYKPMLACDVPRELNVQLLGDATNPGAFGGSKASGEPPLSLAASFLSALRRAVVAARQELHGGLWSQMKFPLVRTPVTPSVLLAAIHGE